MKKKKIPVFEKFICFKECRKQQLTKNKFHRLSACVYLYDTDFAGTLSQ